MEALLTILASGPAPTPELRGTHLGDERVPA
jgi:hypothetical protein